MARRVQEWSSPNRAESRRHRLVLLYLSTYSPWLNPVEMLWRHFRREVTHCELFASVKALLAAAAIAATANFFARYNHESQRMLPSSGPNPRSLRECT